MCQELTHSCVIGIDPGSVYLGLTTLWFDSRKFEISQVYAKTLYGNRYTQYPNINSVYGGTQSMLLGHEQYLLKHFDIVKPVAVFCESPFYNSRMPAAFGSLIKTLEHIKSACIHYDPYMHFDTVDPPTAKKAIGASGGSRDKADMLLALQRTDFYNKIIFEEVTEHAVDSVAMAYWGYKKYILGI